MLREKQQKASGGATHGAHGEAGSAHRASHQTGEMRQCPELQIGDTQGDGEVKDYGCLSCNGEDKWI